jgi:hypothetical protein
LELDAVIRKNKQLMKLFIDRKPSLLTWLMKYKIDINDKEFVLRKSGVHPIEIEDTDELHIYVNLRNYYSGETEIRTVKANDTIEISPSYNKNLMLFLFFLTLITFILGIVITEIKIVGWIPGMIFLGVQFYYFHIRSTEFFKISIR